MTPCVRNLKVAQSCFDGFVANTEVFRVDKDIAGRSDTAGMLWIGVAPVQETAAGVWQNSDAAVNAAADLPLGKPGATSFALLDPGSADGCEVGAPAQPSGRLRVGHWRRVGGVVVDKQLHAELRTHGRSR